MLAHTYISRVYWEVLDLRPSVLKTLSMDQFVNYIIENNQHLVFILAAIIALVCLIWFVVIYRSVKLDVINPSTKNIQSLKLKEDLNKKNKELERMKHRLEMQQKKLTDLSEGGGDNSELVGSLKTEIEDLKAKLSDYEIIEDDIANLSKYKAENEKLIEKLSKYESKDKGSEVSKTDNPKPKES